MKQLLTVSFPRSATKMSVDLELWGSSMIGESALMSSLILAPLVALSVTCGREEDYTSTTTIDFEFQIKIS